MRAKMDRGNRAKQFMPFAALTGLESAMQEKESVPLEEILLGPDAQTELDQRLQSLPIGTEVCAVYYSSGRYLVCRGTFRGKDEEYGCLRIGEERIDPDRLLNIERCE